MESPDSGSVRDASATTSSWPLGDNRQGLRAPGILGGPRRRRRVPRSGGGLVDTVGDTSFAARSLACSLVSHFREKAYSPNCVEEEFSEVRLQKTEYPPHASPG